MKRFLAVILTILLILSIFSEVTMADSHTKATIDIEFIGNLIFSKYDVDIYINTQKLKTLSHGKDYTGMFYAEKGTYTIYFYKSDNHKVSGKIDLEIRGDTQISCRISCYRDHIDVSRVTIQMEESTQTPKITPQPTPVVTKKPDSPTKKIGSSENIVTLQPEEPKATAVVRPMPSIISESTSWHLSYNCLTDISRKITLHTQKGDETVLVGHYLPAGRYHIENMGNTPAQIKFYLEGIQKGNGDEILKPSGKDSINLFAGAETDFSLQNGEYIVLADGSTNLYCESTDGPQF